MDWMDNYGVGKGWEKYIPDTDPAPPLKHVAGPPYDWDRQLPGIGNHALRETKRCEHVEDPIVLGEGVTLYVTASRDQMRRQYEADHMVILDPSQRPDCLGTYVPWPDFGVPNLSFEQMTDIVYDVIWRARGGEMVEVGCIGAHGRTGTFLAMVDLAILLEGDITDLRSDEMRVYDSVDKIRLIHCDKAVEGQKQEQYLVEWFKYLIENGSEF